METPRGYLECAATLLLLDMGFYGFAGILM